MLWFYLNVVILIECHGFIGFILMLWFYLNVVVLFECGFI